MKRKSVSFIMAMAMALGGLVFVTLTASAAELIVSSSRQRVYPGERFQIFLELTSLDQPINAISGELILPPAVFEIKKINDAGSLISLWIERPRWLGATTTAVAFSGLMAGGVTVQNARLFSLELLALKEPGELISKTVSIGLRHPQALISDGTGQAAVVSAVPLSVKIDRALAPATAGASLRAESPKLDNVPPESFAISVARYPALFAGQWFVAFNTRDADSGLDHYEIQEARASVPNPNQWRPAASPFVLSDQERASFIFVRAIDNSGNVTLAASPPASIAPRYATFLFWCILLVGILILGIFAFFRYGKVSGSR